MLIGMGGEVKPALMESRLVIIQLEPRTRKKIEEKEHHNMTKNPMPGRAPFCQELWKHVAVWKSLMATHAHDIRLNVRRKELNVIWKDLTVFLSLSPVRTIGVQIGNQAVFVAESKCISSIVLPSDVLG
jgi:hypothetical protein